MIFSILDIYKEMNGQQVFGLSWSLIIEKWKKEK